MGQRAAAGVEQIDLGPVDVEAEHAEPGAGRGPHQRQADIAEPDDADHRLARGDAREPDREIGGCGLGRQRRVAVHRHVRAAGADARLLARSFGVAM